MMNPRDWSQYDESWADHYNDWVAQQVARAKAKLAGRHEPCQTELQCESRYMPITAMVEAMGGDERPDMLVQVLNIRLLPEWVRP